MKIEFKLSYNLDKLVGKMVSRHCCGIKTAKVLIDGRVANAITEEFLYLNHKRGISMIQMQKKVSISDDIKEFKLKFQKVNIKTPIDLELKLDIMYIKCSVW